MKIYVPTLIESVEQAEKLPEGTVVAGVARRTGRFEVAFRDADGTYWGSTCSIEDDEDTIGMQALVPVEAKEERTRAEPFADATIHVSPQYWRDDPSRRLVTPWTPDGPTATKW